MTDRGDDPIEWTATELAMAAARGDRAVDNCEPVGVWGATTPQERQRLRARREAA